KDDRFVRAIFSEQAPEARKPTAVEEGHFTPQQRNAAQTAQPVFTKPLTINFATGSSVLTGGARQNLDSKEVPLLRTSSNAFFRIEGNTDNVGNHDGNIALSERRARAVVDYLVNRGFNVERLIPIGNGPDKPIASNADASGRQANRRTDIKLIA